MRSALFLLFLACCSAEDKQDAIDAAPKQFELNIHVPIPPEPWILPPDNLG